MLAELNFVKFPKFAVLIALLAALSAAQDSWALPPLRILACEAMLQSGLDKFAEPHSILPPLRDIRYRIQREARIQSDTGIAYTPGSVAGLPKNVPPQIAHIVVQRLNGIEKDLTQTHPDAQVVAFEFRGPKVRQALNAMLEAQAALKSRYEEAKVRAFDEWVRIAGPALGFLAYGAGFALGVETGEMLYRSIVDPTSFHVVSTALLGAFSIAYNGALGLGTLGRLNHQRAFDHEAVDAFVNIQEMKPNEDEIFAGSAVISLPVRFNKMLMDDSTPEEAKDVARERAALFASAGNVAAYLQSKVERTKKEVTADLVNDGGEIVRYAFMDHILFTDKETKELVWLYVFRSFRKRPMILKPKTEAQPEEEAEFNWSPGAARPALLPVPASR